MKKYLLFFILMVAGLSTVSAEESLKGIIATYEGSEVSYMLEDMPVVKYETVEGVQHAVLYLKGKEEPVLRIALADGKELSVIYGECTPTGIGEIGISKVTITERNGRKYIQGGKLIVIGKDGKKSNVNGTPVE